MKQLAALAILFTCFGLSASDSRCFEPGYGQTCNVPSPKDSPKPSPKPSPPATPRKK